jgi:basic amino acid/polyamine antiporter, APA family
MNEAAAPSTARPVGPFQLLALGVNGIVGVGIFFAPAQVAGYAPGAAAILVFAATGLALLPVALAFAVLGRRFDVDGGPVVFARAAFGDFVSFVVGWVAYVSAFFSTSAVMMGLAGAVAPSLGLEGPLARHAAATLLVTVIALVVASGIRISARTWTTLTVLKLLPLVALLAVFLLHRKGPLPSVEDVSSSWFRGALLVVFTCQGFEIVPVIAGHVRSSARAVPFATVGSLLAATVLYVGLIWACVSALPALASSPVPLVDAAAIYGGPALSTAAQWGTSVSALGICLGMMVTTPRYLSVLAAGERELLGLERESVSGVPLRALFVTWAIVAVVVNLGELSELFALSAMSVLMQFGVTAASLARLAWRGKHGLARAHVVLAAYTLVIAGLLVWFGATLREWLVTSGLVASGLALAAFTPRKAVA